MNATLKGFIKKELSQTLRDPKMRGILFIAPVFQLILFGVALSTEVRNIKITAHYKPTDYLVREIYTKAVGTGWFLPTKSSQPDPFDEVQSGDADVVLVAPEQGFTTSLGKAPGAPGSSVPLQVLINATNVIRAQAIEVYLKTIVASVIAENGKFPPPQPPIQFRIRVLYNPTLESAIFMVPGVLCLLLCVSTLLLTNMSISREKEMGTFEMLISAPVHASEIILGKTVPFVVLGMANFPLILGASVILFGVPVRGSLVFLFIAAFLFICTTVALGMLISSISRTQQQAMLGGFLYLFPAILFSGLIFPLENMPSSMQILAWLDPLSHLVGLLRNIMLKGGDYYYMGVHMGSLFILGSVIIFVSFKRFHTTLQ